MKLSNKLRELSSLDKSVDVPSLILEAERLEAQNARLRELVREAFSEGVWAYPLCGHANSTATVDEVWLESQAKAAIDALDKEGSDA